MHAGFVFRRQTNKLPEMHAVGITKFKYLFQMTHSNVFMPMSKSKLQLKDWVPKLKDKLYIGHKTS